MNPEDYVSYPLALALKKHGFDWKCMAFYAHTDGKMWVADGEEDWNSGVDYSAPTLWQAQKWLREVKRIEVKASWESIKRYWFFYTNFMDVPDIVNLEGISGSVYST